MIYTSKPIGSRGTVPGIAGELDALKADLSTILVAARGSLLDGMGSPAGAKRVDRARVLARLEVYESPDSQAALKAVGDGDLVRLTKEAIRARSSAMETGAWAPKAQDPWPEPPASPAPEPIPQAFPDPMAPMGPMGPTPPGPMGPMSPMPQGPMPPGLMPPGPMDPGPMAPMPPGPMAPMPPVFVPPAPLS